MTPTPEQIAENEVSMMSDVPDREGLREDLGASFGPGCQAPPSAAGASSQSGIPRAWLPIIDAPRDGTHIIVRTFDGVMLEAKWEDGFMDDEERPCGGWVATVEDCHPADWHGGVCWASNEDENRSDPPMLWMATDSDFLAGAAAMRALILDDVRDLCGRRDEAKRPRMATEAVRQYGQRVGTIDPLYALAFASTIEARSEETAQQAQPEGRERDPKGFAQTQAPKEDQP